ncbi:hypothetical protein NYQ44_01455 [Xanthomonas translucens pv. undulosa]|nr:hypothetical protein [Xanthomonas translucens]MCT8269396.1 hypothetical protein [Xanthomonas translucens pv. undulosa]QSQ59456.1 hypothetical protein ISN38_14990 [Xanthomonas translucens pv. undulosa]
MVRAPTVGISARCVHARLREVQVLSPERGHSQFQQDADHESAFFDQAIAVFQEESEIVRLVHLVLIRVAPSMQCGMRCGPCLANADSPGTGLCIAERADVRHRA